MNSDDLWDQTAEQLLRAERLLAHSLAGLEQAEAARRHDRERVALEVEHLLLNLNTLSQGLTTVIEELARDRQDNRLQRWQGQLQQLLTPLDHSGQALRELIAMLDGPLERSSNGASPRSTPEQQRQQLQELLALRQKQIVLLQAEVSELQQQGASSSSQQPSPEPGTVAPAPQPTTPSIFN